MLSIFLGLGLHKHTSRMYFVHKHYKYIRPTWFNMASKWNAYYIFYNGPYQFKIVEKHILSDSLWIFISARRAYVRITVLELNPFSQETAYHCRFLVPGNSTKILHDIWHQFWVKNDGEKWCHWNYFQIPWALSDFNLLTSLAN